MELFIIAAVIIVIAIVVQIAANNNNNQKYERAMKRTLIAIEATGFVIEKTYESWDGVRMLFHHSHQRIAIIYGHQYEEFMSEIPFDIYDYHAVSSADMTTSYSDKETYYHVKVMLKDFDNSFVVMTFANIGQATDLSAKLEIAIKSTPQKVEVVNPLSPSTVPPTSLPTTPIAAVAETDRYDVIIIHSGAERAQVVGTIVEFLNCEIDVAGQMIEHAPAFVANGLSVAKATELRNRLQSRGATVEVQRSM